MFALPSARSVFFLGDADDVHCMAREGDSAEGFDPDFVPENLKLKVQKTKFPNPKKDAIFGP